MEGGRAEVGRARPTRPPLLLRSTDGERNRRLDALDALRARREALQAQLRRGASGGGGGGAAPPATTSRPRETDATAPLTTASLLASQRDEMAAQDDALEALERSARTTKHVALAVGDELDLQARLLDDLDDDVAGTGARLAAAARQLRGVAARSGGCRSLCGGVLALAVAAVFAILFIRIARLL